MLWMKRNAYADTTIKATGKRLKHLQKNTNLTQPEQVKTFIANKKCGNAFKECLIETYDLLMRSIGLKWEKPMHRKTKKIKKPLSASIPQKRGSLYLSCPIGIEGQRSQDRKKMKQKE